MNVNQDDQRRTAEAAEKKDQEFLGVLCELCVKTSHVFLRYGVILIRPSTAGATSRLAVTYFSRAVTIVSPFSGVVSTR